MFIGRIDSPLGSWLPSVSNYCKAGLRAGFEFRILECHNDRDSDRRVRAAGSVSQSFTWNMTLPTRSTKVAAGGDGRQCRIPREHRWMPENPRRLADRSVRM